MLTSAQRRQIEIAALAATREFQEAANQFKATPSAKNFRELTRAALAHQDAEHELDEAIAVERNEELDADAVITK